MSTEAFVWPYRHGEPTTFAFAEVLSAFGQSVTRWDAADGCLQLDLGEDSCTVFCGKDVAETGRVPSLTIFNPVRLSALWQPILRLMSESDAVLFFSDDTTPLFWDVRSASHFPPDLIESLGAPRAVRSPEDIVAIHEQ